MALDRQSIERRDFPTGRRGYEPEAVHAHLARIAGEVEALQRAAPEPVSAGQAASDQVRAIVDAAEGSAAEIRRAARDEAAGHVAEVREATARLLQRLQAIAAELEELERGVGELRGVAPAAAAAPPPPAAAPAPPVVTAEPAAAADEPDEDVVVVPERAAPAAAAGDVEGARLVALNMALSGTAREETDRYLAEHFELEDRATLLDEVYATVES
jgi:hypothetical protein